MKNNPDEFVPELSIKKKRIVLHPFNAYINLPFDQGRIIRQIKCYNIGEFVMFQKALIDVQQVFIRTKNIIQRFKSPFLILH
jgi:hypothetical protein